MKMTVLYVKDTGHVLAAVTRAAAVSPGPAPAEGEASADVLALTGPELMLRARPPESIESRVPVAAKDLAVLDADVDLRVLQAPGDYAVLDGKTLGVMPTADAPDPVRATDHASVALTLTAAVASETPMQLHLVPRGGGDALHLAGSFKPSTPTDRTIRFSPSRRLDGEWIALTLVSGYRPKVGSFGP